MIAKEITLPFDERGYCELMLGACWHIGQPSVSYDGIHLFLEKAQRNPWVHHGDLIEAIVPTDARRFTIGEHTVTLVDQKSEAKRLLGKAGQTCLGLVTGNHEHAISKKEGNISKEMAEDAKVPFLGMCCFMRMRTPEGQLVSYFAHGSKGFNYKAGEPERIPENERIKLRNENKRFDADLISVAHAHTSVITPPVLINKLQLQENSLEVKRRPVPVHKAFYSATPSMFRTYVMGNEEGSYGELAQFKPSEIGWHSAIIEKDGKISRMLQYDQNGDIVHESIPKILA